MATDPTVREEAFPYFVSEANDLLQNIEQDLLSLREDRTSAKIHSLMRSAHTLKGAAATVGLETVKHVAHVLEDVFRALYNPDIDIDDEVEALLFEGYDCLRSPLMAEIHGSPVDESDIFNRAAAIISRLQDKLGDLFDRETPIPTSEELGFDVVQSMFEVGVEQRLNTLAAMLETASPEEMMVQLKTMAEVFWGLAESLQLPGFGRIAQLSLEALEANPGEQRQVIEVAYGDLRAAQQAVLTGDRTQGGQASARLEQLAQGLVDSEPQSEMSKPDTQSVSQPSSQPSSQTSSQPLPLDIGASLDALFGEGPVLDLAFEEGMEEAAEEQGMEAAFGNLDQLFGAVNPEDLAMGFELALSPILPMTGTLGEATAEEEVEVEAEVEATAQAIARLEPLPEFLVSEALTLEALTSEALTSEPKVVDLAPIDLTQSTPTASVPTSSAPTAPTPAIQALSVPVASVSSSRSVSTKAAVPIASSADTAHRKGAQVNVRVGLEQVLQLDHWVGELLTNQIQTTEEDEQLRAGIRELLEQLRHHRRTLGDLQSCAQQIGLDEWELDRRLIPKPTESPKVSSRIAIPQLPLSAQFDALEMDRYSDLHIFTQKALNEAVQLEIVIEAVDQLTKRTRQTRDSRQRLFQQLRDGLAAVRLKPISELFNRFPRVLQQLCTTYGKPVNLTLTGSHVLVDKVTLDSLYDSLLHLVRNAFDHGIEDPEKRLAQGKPAVGQIELCAYHQGNRTVIEIRDDGQGVNLQRIAEKAISQGLLDATATDQISEAELLEFLFHSGFSTASQVSDLSGRGVGLDVVRSQIEKLEGSLSVRSEEGKGTTFLLYLPLSVTITKQLICLSNGNSYAIAADSVQQVLLPRPGQLRTLGDGRLVLNYRQAETEIPIPVQPLAHLIRYAEGSGQHSAPAMAEKSPILLIACPEGLRGIQVDQVIGEQEVSIRSLGTAIAPPPCIQGCTVLGDNNLALAIEPQTLLAQTYEAAQARTIAIGLQSAKSGLRRQPNGPQAPRVLIVDDSLTQRRTLERTLVTVGYEVEQAEDGLEALIRLKQETGFDLIVCDLEMPRMNGFEFLSQKHGLSQNAQIPVIILTSRGGSKYRQLALGLGAAAFLSKPYTDYELLNQVAELIQTQKPAAVR